MKAREIYSSLAYLGKSQQNWAFFHLVGKAYGDVFLDNPELDVEERLEEIEEAYRGGQPLAYILGESYFYGRRFNIDKRVLIPRPETEGLVERALELSWERALDLCTGSGVIAISLALERGLRIQALDISGPALELARLNAQELSAPVDFFKSDLFEGVSGDFDLIISNPPYIRSSSLGELEVSKREPLLALDGGEEGLDIIIRIIEGARIHLKKGGHLLLEIGDDQGQDILNLTQDFYGRIEEDLAGKPRYYIGRKV